MKLDIQIVKTIRGAAQHHHPALRRRRALPSLGWEKWTTLTKRGFFSEAADEAAHQSVCSTAVFGYSAELLELFEKASNAATSVSIDSDVMEGQPCISGTRIPVRSILRAIEHYGSMDGVIECYPHLTKDQVKDALYFSQVLLEPQSGIDEASTAA